MNKDKTIILFIPFIPVNVSSRYHECVIRIICFIRIAEYN